ncbi:dirigent protein 2-like [Zingiber officinale]|uniref:dirigent protein 2-like n=1 Tax=Zingiber officinale TaxID=94328 RepID=UPI001C4A7F5E|nr:dirigent protein 2-like [Zingiber officinale]
MLNYCMMEGVVSFPSFILFLLLSSATVTFAQNYSEHLHFYFLERVAGSPNATSVVSVDLHPESPAGGFGNIGVIDNILLEGPEPSSPAIGRAQGLVVYSDLTGLSVTTALNLVLTAGDYNGSSLAMYGRYEPARVSDRSIIGGSGQFRLARGYALSQRVATTATTLTDVLDVYITYP